MPTVTASDIATQLGVPSDRVRTWLREKQRSGDDRLAGHEPGSPWRFSRDLADGLMREYLFDAGVELEYVDGPHGWWNWRMQRAGRPARDSTGEGIIVRPSWVEYALYSDAPIGGEVDAGPFTLKLVMNARAAMIGRSTLQLVLRAHDHLPEPDDSRRDHEAESTGSYHGGDMSHEFAGLLSLALGRRLRSGGVVRQGFANHDPLGDPWEALHEPPALIPPRREPMLPGIAAGASLAEAAPLLTSYPDLEGPDAVVLVRAAQQYADALWIADADPRLAWIKLVGAIETAAGHWKAQSFSTPVQQLKRHRPRLYKALRGAPADVVERVAEDIAHTFNVERKFQQFIKAFDPGPPPKRPIPGGQVDWSKLEDVLTVIYEYRSGELHAGLPFPAPLLEPPLMVPDDEPPERFPLVAQSGWGGSWPAERLPMYLHVFAHLVRGSLCSWWASLGSAPKE
jgi:hypothetical protein